MSETLAPRRRSMARRPIMALLAAGIAMASLGAGAAPASADHTVCKRNYRFVPVVLTAEDIEDWWPDNTDEIQLTYPGQNYRTTMKQYERRYPPVAPIYAQIPGSSFNVSLYEWDGTSRRLLGSVSIPWTGTSDRLLHFYGPGDYSYTLTYRVEDLGAASCVQYKWVPNMEWEDAKVAEDVLNDHFTVVKEYRDNCLDPGIVQYQTPKDVERPLGSDVLIRVGTCTWGQPK